jgi:hypothetical protein
MNHFSRSSNQEKFPNEETWESMRNGLKEVYNERQKYLQLFIMVASDMGKSKEEIFGMITAIIFHKKWSLDFALGKDEEVLNKVSDYLQELDLKINK